MDILSPTYSPTEGVARPVPATITLTGVDAAIDAEWGVEDDDATAPVRAALAECQRDLHDLGMTLLEDDWEARMAAVYALTDLTDRIAGLRLALELSL